MDFSGLVHDFGPLTVSGLVQGAIIALFALGYTLVYGVLRLINFAHSEVFMMGTFACVVAWHWFGLDQNSATPSFGGMVVYLLIGLTAAIVASGMTALIVELVAYRPLRRRNAPPMAFLITAIGASVTISEIVGVLTHRRQRGVPPVVAAKTVIAVGDTHLTTLQILIVVLALAMMVALDRFINGSRLGRGIRALAQNPDSAALMGVHRSRVISLVFLLGGVMAGIAAVMYDLKIGVTRYDAGFLLGVDAFAAAVLGGIGNLRGALLGGLLLGVLQNYAAGVFGSQWLHAAAYVVLVLVLLVRPTGLLSESLGRIRA